MIKKCVLFIKMIHLRLRFGKRLKMKHNRLNIRADTEINVCRNGLMDLGDIAAQTNVHLVCVEGQLKIGSSVSFNRNCIIICRQRITIGDNCMFGPNVCIFDHDHMFNHEGIIPNEYRCSEIVIETGCWIGAGTTILKGTHVGKNTIIGAGSVVKGDIPSNSIVRSNREMEILPIKERLG